MFKWCHFILLLTQKPCTLKIRILTSGFCVILLFIIISKELCSLTCWPKNIFIKSWKCEVGIQINNEIENLYL